MQPVKKYNQKTPKIPVRSSFSFWRQTADDEGQKKIVQKKRERECVCVCVCGRTPERNDLLCASSSSLSLSLPCTESSTGKRKRRFKRRGTEWGGERFAKWRRRRRRSGEARVRGIERAPYASLRERERKDFSGRNKRNEISPLLCLARPTALWLFI